MIVDVFYPAAVRVSCRVEFPLRAVTVPGLTMIRRSHPRVTRRFGLWGSFLAPQAGAAERASRVHRPARHGATTHHGVTRGEDGLGANGARERGEDQQRRQEGLGEVAYRSRFRWRMTKHDGP